MSIDEFEEDSMVAVRRPDGLEVVVRFLGVTNTGDALVQSESGLQSTVSASRLLPLKHPCFEVRGLVATASASHPGEVGEIVAMGKAASGKQAFKVAFSDQTTEWFTDDQVFIEDVQRVINPDL